MVDKEYWEQRAYQWVTLCENFIQQWHDDFSLVRCKLDWSTRRRSSRGGWYNGPGINIAMALHTHKNGIYRQYEYPSFDSDPEIGGFYSTCTNHSLGMVVCHEMAHAVQFYRHRILDIEMDRPHGNSFKTPYRALRKAILNPHLPKNQAELADRYNPLGKK